MTMIELLWLTMLIPVLVLVILGVRKRQRDRTRLIQAMQEFGEAWTLLIDRIERGC